MFILPPSSLKCSCYSNEVAGASPTKHSLPPPFPAASKIVSSLGPLLPFCPILWNCYSHSTPVVLCTDAFLFFSFFGRAAACGIFVPRPGFEPVPSAVRARSPNHLTAREVPHSAFQVTETGKEDS